MRTLKHNIHKRTGFLATLFTIGMLFFSTAHAQCPMVDYKLTGTVLDTEKNPVVAADIHFHWEESGGDQLMAREKSNEKGEFDATIRFSTLLRTKVFGGDICTAKLQSIRIRVVAEGFGNYDKPLRFVENEAVQIVLTKK